MSLSPQRSSHPKVAPLVESPVKATTSPNKTNSTSPSTSPLRGSRVAIVPDSKKDGENSPSKELPRSIGFLSNGPNATMNKSLIAELRGNLSHQQEIPTANNDVPQKVSTPISVPERSSVPSPASASKPPLHPSSSSSSPTRQLLMKSRAASSNGSNSEALPFRIRSPAPGASTIPQSSSLAKSLETPNNQPRKASVESPSEVRSGSPIKRINSKTEAVLSLSPTVEKLKERASSSSESDISKERSSSSNESDKSSDQVLMINRIPSRTPAASLPIDQTRFDSASPVLKRIDSGMSEQGAGSSSKRSSVRSMEPVAPTDPTALASMFSHRARVVEEILSSERVFLGLLLDFLGCYYVALCAEREQASMDFMSRSGLVGLCSNIEQISAVSQQLLSELTEAATTCGDPSKAELGEVFLCTSSLLKLYGQYAENHSAARHDIRAMVQSPVFRAFWDRVETDAMLGRGPGGEAPRMPSTSATLDGYLILPIQRVPRYLLLLKELIKTTPGDHMRKENERLTRAIEEVGNAAKFMNECIWRAEQKEILRDLQGKFVGTVVDFIGGVGLAGYRALIHEGELVRVTSKNTHRTYYFHLMNDALVYSRANGSGGFRFHRALSLTGSCSVSESSPIANPAYEVYTSENKLSCAFKISTPEKSFVVYAATPELKAKWMDQIAGAIRAQASLEAHVRERAEAEKKKIEGVSTDDSKSEEAAGTDSATAPTLQSATDRCQMCRAPLYVFTRRLNCERCGLLVCGTCGSNHRVLPGKLKARQLRTTLPVCCACAWEMDGTAVDASVDEFRLKVWVEDVQSLVGGVGGHAIVESATEGQKKAQRHLDAVEALKRLYFSLTSKHRGEDRYRGPSNAGMLGPDASFSMPIGLPSDEHLSLVTLHVHMVGVGEIGRVPIRIESIVTEPEVTRAQPFHKWHVVAPTPGTTAVSTLAVTLIQATGKDAIHLRLSDKERGALRIGLKVCFELHVPPSLWGAHFYQTERGRSSSSQTRQRNTSISTNRPGALKAVSQSAELQDDVAVRLKRFMGMDDPAFTVGGTNVDAAGANGMREKLNVSLLTEYERRVVKNPTIWGLSLTDTLYSDCLAHYGAMARSRASLYSDTQLTLLNKLHVFHSTPEIISLMKKRVSDTQKPSASLPKAGSGPTTPGRVLERDNKDVLLQAAQRQASHLEERRPSRNIEISRKALLGQDRDRKKKNMEQTHAIQERGEEDEEEQEEEQLDADDRETILKQLYESEKKYLESLVILDEVFVARLIQVAQGADIRLATLKRTDVWAEKMGLSGPAPTMTTGIQTMNTGVLGRAKSIMQKSPSKMFSKELFRPSLSPGGGASPSSPNRSRGSGIGGGEDKDDDNDGGHDDVRSILRQPFVTVLMQSVKQIRTVNQEFYNSLGQKLDDKKRFSPDVCVGDVLERFVGVMPVYSTYASHHPFVLEELTNARTEDEGWDARWSMNARAMSKSLDALLTACEADPKCEGRTLKTFLNLPLERVETYRSALSALLMCTPRTHPDWNRMRLALGKIVESTKHMTRAVRRRENIERLREIDSMMEDWPEGFQLVDPKRWLVREGCLIERQTFAKRDTHRARHFWLFSDCLVMATKSSRSKTLTRLKSWGGSSEILAQIGSALVSSAGDSSLASPGGAAGMKKFRFKRLINIGDMTICDLPHGVQSSTAGLVLGDPFFAFCIASVSSPSFVVLVPNNPTECNSRVGPAPVELARVGPPPVHGISTEASKGRPAVVYDKAAVKASWISDILLCIEMFQRKAAFDDDEGVQFSLNNNNNNKDGGGGNKSPLRSEASFKRSSIALPTPTSPNSKLSPSSPRAQTGTVGPTVVGATVPQVVSDPDAALLNGRSPSPKEFAMENPGFSPVRVSSASKLRRESWRRSATLKGVDGEDVPADKVVEKESF